MLSSLDGYIDMKKKHGRSINGGGQRSVSLCDSSTLDDILDVVKKTLCSGRKTKFGDVCNLQFEIGTSSQEIIQHFIEYDGRNVPFTLLTY